MRLLLLVVTLLAMAFPAMAQVLPFPPAAQVKLALNPLTGKSYAIDEANNRVLVFDRTGANIGTVAVGPRPQYIAVDPTSNRIYVNNAGDSSLTILDGATDTNLTPTPKAIGSVGSISVNPVTGIVYIIRFTSPATDEVTFYRPATDTWYTIATESWQPISMAIDPVRDRIYVVHYAGDLRIISGAYNESDFFPQTVGIPIWQRPFAVVANPVTDRAYAIVDDTRGPISVIDGASKTASFPAVTAGHGVSPKGLAINTATNKMYAAFKDEVIVIDGASGGLTYVPASTGSGPAAVAVNAATNKVYVAADNGVLTILDGATNTTTTATIPAGQTTLGINPLTNQVFVYNGATLTVRAGATGTPYPLPLTTSISTLPGNSSGPNPTFTFNVTGTYASGLPGRAVYVQLDGAGAWTRTSGTGPYTASFTGLSGGSHTVRAFAVDSQEAPLSTGPQSHGVVGAVASYTFSVTSNVTVSLASSANPSFAGQAVTFTASVSGSSGTPTGTVAFRDGANAVANCGSVTLASGSATCTTSALALGTHAITAAYSGNATYNAATSSALSQQVTSAPQPGVSLSRTAIDFGGQSMRTSSAPVVVTVTNTGNAPLDVTNVGVSGASFSRSHDCASVGVGASCSITVVFTPDAAPSVPLNGTQAASGTVTIASNAPGSPHTVSLAGTAEKSLVTHFYRSILRRAADSQGKDFWQAEAQRMASAGANVNEAWFAMAAAFYASAEYTSQGRDNAGYVSDLYTTFFNRAPDPSGVSFWTNELANGMPREVVLVSFTFSAEFREFTRAIFGDTTARAEVDTVVDFYRGLLARLPDADGFASWVGRFRAAQCDSRAAVVGEVESISAGFANGAEYAGRGRGNAQFVGDMYQTFLRRGGDADGVRFWIGELDAGRRSRDDVRRAFIATPEFARRVDAIVAEGCMR